MSMRPVWAIVGAALLLIGAQARAASPPAGVYGCYEAAPSMSSGRMSIRITPAPVMMFGLIDAATYSDYDGKRGRYAFDGAVLTMLDGSRQGWRYQKVGDWAFQALDAAGELTSYTCPLEPQKDPARGPW